MYSLRRAGSSAIREATTKPQNILLRLATAFYYRSLKVNTIHAIQNIVNEKPDSEALPALVSRFWELKGRENSYVQIAVSKSREAKLSDIIIASFI